MNDNDSNVVIDKYLELRKLKDNNIIQDFSIKYNEENEIIDVHIVPISKVQHLNVNFEITKEGIEF